MLSLLSTDAPQSPLDAIVGREGEVNQETLAPTFNASQAIAAFADVINPVAWRICRCSTMPMVAR